MKLLEQDELEELDELDNAGEKSGNGDKKPPLTAILLGIIIVLLICIGALLLILTSRQRSLQKTLLRHYNRILQIMRMNKSRMIKLHHHPRRMRLL